jgi:hypothetical protein
MKSFTHIPMAPRKRSWRKLYLQLLGGVFIAVCLVSLVVLARLAMMSPKEVNEVASKLQAESRKAPGILTNVPASPESRMLPKHLAASSRAEDEVKDELTRKVLEGENENRHSSKSASLEVESVVEDQEFDVPLENGRLPNWAIAHHRNYASGPAQPTPEMFAEREAREQADRSKEKKDPDEPIVPLDPYAFKAEIKGAKRKDLELGSAEIRERLKPRDAFGAISEDSPTKVSLGGGSMWITVKNGYLINQDGTDAILYTPPLPKEQRASIIARRKRAKIYVKRSDGKFVPLSYVVTGTQGELSIELDQAGVAKTSQILIEDPTRVTEGGSSRGFDVDSFRMLHTRAYFRNEKGRM